MIFAILICMQFLIRLTYRAQIINFKKIGDCKVAQIHIFNIVE